MKDTSRIIQNVPVIHKKKEAIIVLMDKFI